MGRLFHFPAIAAVAALVLIVVFWSLGNGSSTSTTLPLEMSAVASRKLFSRRDHVRNPVAGRNYTIIAGKEVFHREYIPAKASGDHLLLLHGAAFSSSTWDELGTYDELSSKLPDLHVVAIDIPGFGKSRGPRVGSVSDRIAFLTAVLDTFHMDEAVIVSPSMSGVFAVPFLLEKSNRVSGFIPIAPGAVTRDMEDSLRMLSVPTLIMYGSLDASGKERSEILHAIPESRIVEFVNGRHPCYLDDPALFHRELITFLSRVFGMTVRSR